MTITVYKSTDASAPILTGAVGTLAAVLDACLVNGYGAKAAAGWAIAFTGTNTRAYRAASGNRMYLSLDDTAATDSRFISYEAMTAVLTGTNPCPSTVQLSGGTHFWKSVAASATARPWFIIASETFLYLVVEPAETVLGAFDSNQSAFMFGDIISNKTGDAFGTLLMGMPSAAGSVSPLGNQDASNAGAIPSAAVNHYMQRAFTQLGTSIIVAKVQAQLSGSLASNNFGGDTSSSNFPDPITGGALFAEVFITEQSGSQKLPRGKVPGFYGLRHNATALAAAYNHLDTIAGTGAYAGLTFILLKVYGTGVLSYIAIQITGTWG